MTQLDIWGDPVSNDATTHLPDMTTFGSPARPPRFQDQITAPMGLVIDPKIPVGLHIVSGPETCPHCDGPTQKTGSCYTCIVCGSTTGCG